MDYPAEATRGAAVDPLAGAVWRRSSYSGTQGNCVEVAVNLPGLVAVRDSKDPEGPRLVIGDEAWRAFVRSMRDKGSNLGNWEAWAQRYSYATGSLAQRFRAY